MKTSLWGTPLVMLLLAAASACVFDGSALEERRCLYSEECGEGLACVGGFCQPAPAKGEGEGNNPANNNPANNNPNNNNPGVTLCPDGTLPNLCGGCEPLLGLPGTACGSCDDGEWVCTSQGEATCEGGTAERDYYADSDGDTYGNPDDAIQDCQPIGIYNVQEAGDCDDDNAQAHPNRAEVCDGLDNDCDDTVDEGVQNACGGCATLDAPPDTACGAGGTWQCQGAAGDTVACVGGAGNACGGSAELQGSPGERCGQCGTLACKTPERLECDDPGRNACGGCSTLANAPNTACGACGERVCDGQEATRCDDPGQNACGGCGALSGAPGAPCGTCGALRCDGEDALLCEGGDANACGGCAVLPAQLGGTCGTCGLDRWECSGTDALRCSGDTACSGELTRVAAGSFLMGSPAGEPGRSAADEPQRTITISRPFLAMRHEVTAAQWEELMGSLPPGSDCYSSRGFSRSGGSCPAHNISWDRAIELANRRSTQEGLTPCYTTVTTGNPDQRGLRWDTNCTGYRLPTEAEWEYMTRAGTTTAVYRGAISLVTWANGCVVDQNTNVFYIAWTCQDGRSLPTETQRASANPWGIQDVSGNVAEWVWDRYAPPGANDATDPNTGTLNRCGQSGADAECNRTVRGGAWRDGADKVRSAARVGMDGRTAQPTVGLRLVRTLFE